MPERELLHRLPRAPEITKSAQSRHRFQRKINEKTNATITAVQQMELGQLDEKSLNETKWGEEPLDTESEEPMEQRVCFVRGIHARRAKEKEAQVTSEKALERILKMPTPEVSGEELDPDGPAGIPSRTRGEMVPSDPERTDLPEEGNEPRPVQDLSQRVRTYYARPESMLKEVTEELKEEVERTRMYMCPVFRQKNMLLRLLERMYGSGFLAFYMVANAYVSIFSVVKKDVENPDGTISEVLRLIFDCRKTNVLWRDPPTTRLTTSSQLGFIDLSPSTRRGRRVAVCGGDVPWFYYHLGIASWMTSYFIIPGVTAMEFVKYMAAKGMKIVLPSSEHVHIGVRVITMGWLWAVWSANTVLQDVISGKVPELGWRTRIIYGFPVPFMTTKGYDLLHFQYIDDWGVIMLLAATEPEEFAKTLAGRILKAVRAALRAAGLGCHKESCGDRMEVLGSFLGPSPESPEEIVVGPTASRYHMLEKGTEVMLRKGTASAREMEQMLGHWIPVMLLCRLSMSVFHSSYDFIKTFKHDKMAHVLRNSVRAELAVARALLPLILAVLTAAWWPGAYAVDASDWGEAAVETKAKEKEVRKEARWAEDKGWFTPMGELGLGAAPPFPVCLEDGEDSAPAWESGKFTGAGGSSGRRSKEHGVDILGFDTGEIIEESKNRRMNWSESDPVKGRMLPVTGEERQRRMTEKGFLDLFPGLPRMSEAFLNLREGWAEALDPWYERTYSFESEEVLGGILARIYAGVFGAVHMRPPSFSFGRRNPWILEPHHL